MVFLRIFVGFFDDCKVVVGTVLLHPVHKFAEFCDVKGGGRDLFAQGGHVARRRVNCSAQDALTLIIPAGGEQLNRRWYHQNSEVRS
jgi:hypothetical protein